MISKIQETCQFVSEYFFEKLWTFSKQANSGLLAVHGVLTVRTLIPAACLHKVLKLCANIRHVNCHNFHLYYLCWNLALDMETLSYLHTYKGNTIIRIIRVIFGFGYFKQNKGSSSHSSKNLDKNNVGKWLLMDDVK